MTDVRLMSIGGFSLQSGLSIPALRYYDEIRLLGPASVDPQSGYRRYHPDQVAAARQIYILRALELPIEAVREVVSGQASLQSVLQGHRDRMARRTRALNEIAAAVDNDDNELIDLNLNEFIEHGGASMPERTTCRPVQITIHADDLPRTVKFYAEVFGAEYHEATSSFVFGTWKTDSFFRLCIEPQCPNGDHPGRNACFSFLVDDVDSMHIHAIKAGATEVRPPQDYDWKPRTSIVDDPNGNRIALSQA
jgi:DNA-binding transcriptional MerR regulator/catechol 2,3-dioxygenase-like lactoylglutathione lyase family enzyme